MASVPKDNGRCHEGPAGAKATYKRQLEKSNIHSTSAWTRRVKCVANIDITTCQACCGAMKIIACIEDPIVMRKILDHLDRLARITV